MSEARDGGIFVREHKSICAASPEYTQGLRARQISSLASRLRTAFCGNALTLFILNGAFVLFAGSYCNSASGRTRLGIEPWLKWCSIGLKFSESVDFIFP